MSETITTHDGAERIVSPVAVSYFPAVQYWQTEIVSRQSEIGNEVSPMIAIDFGTTATRAAWFNPRSNHAEALHISEGGVSMPSAVYFGKDEVVAGRAALEMAVTPEESSRVVLSSKRLLTKLTELAVPGRDVTASKVVAEIFRKLKAEVEAEEDLFHAPVRKVIITHPASFALVQIENLRSSAVTAGFEEVQFLEEPLATALAYDYATSDKADDLLVCDFGASAFNFAVVSRNGDGLFRLACPPRMLPIGGDDFDKLLYEYLANIVLDTLGRPVAEDGANDPGFLLSCRHLKELLTQRVACDFYANLSEGTRFHHHIDRSMFNALIRSHVEEAVRMAKSLMNEAASHGCIVQRVLLVGGSARIPLVRELFAEGLPIPLKIWSQQETAVALGAVYFGRHHEGCQDTRPHVRVRVQNNTSLSELIHRIGNQEVDERNRMATIKQEAQIWMRERVLDILVTRANAIEDECKRLNLLLVQQFANRDYAMAQETVSALRRATPDDIELQSAQRFLDSHFDNIGLVRSIVMGAAVNSLTFTSDDKYVVAGLQNGVITICDPIAGIAYKSLSTGNPVTGVGPQADSDQFVSSLGNGNLNLWSIAQGIAMSSMAYGAVATSLVCLPDSKQIAVGGRDKKVKIWDCEKQAIECTFEGHDSEVLTVDCSPGSVFLISGDKNRALKLWSVETGREVRAMSVLQGEVRCVRFLPQSRFAISGHSDGILRVWDVETGREMDRWEGHEGPVTCLQFMPDGRHLVSGGHDKSLRVWDVMSGWQVRIFTEHTAAVNCIAVSADGTYLASGSADLSIRIWNVGV